jgi:hypothetical protein
MGQRLLSLLSEEFIMCNHKNFTSECEDCLDSLYATSTYAALESAYEDGDYIHTNKHGAINELTVISGNVFHTSLMSRPMNCTLEEILAHGGSVVLVELSFDCLACGEMVVTDDEDDHVVGLCDCCLDGGYLW